MSGGVGTGAEERSGRAAARPRALALAELPADAKPAAQADGREG